MSDDHNIIIHRFEKVEPRDDDIREGPHPRSGHRIVADDHSLYSIGGYNPDFWGIENTENTYYPLFKELWQFNFLSRKWTQVHTQGAMPVELASHSALLHGHHLLVFGGTGVPFGESATNKLSICDIRTQTWLDVKCAGVFPIRIYGQSMYIADDQLYIYGGTTGWEYNSEVHRLDLNDRTWSIVDTKGDVPEGRYRHEVACHDNKMYVFGGGRSYLCYGFDKIPMLDLNMRKWSQVHTVPDNVHGFPSRRRCHSCVQLNKAAYLCGGYNGEDIYGDLWRLCLVTLRWTKLDAELPEPAYFHSAAVTTAGCMYVYGGVTEIDTVRTSSVYRVWLQPPASLQELVWAVLCRLVPRMDALPAHALREMGVPHHLVARVHPQGGATIAGGASDNTGPSVCG